jgi:hypothetical protein
VQNANSSKRNQKTILRDCGSSNTRARSDSAIGMTTQEMSTSDEIRNLIRLKRTTVKNDYKTDNDDDECGLFEGGK